MSRQHSIKGGVDGSKYFPETRELETPAADALGTSSVWSQQYVSFLFLQLDESQQVQCGQAPPADDSLGLLAPSLPSSGGSAALAPAKEGLRLSGPSQQPSSLPSSGGSTTQPTPDAVPSSNSNPATQPTPAAASSESDQQRQGPGSGSGSAAASGKAAPSQPSQQHRSSASNGSADDRRLQALRASDSPALQLAQRPPAPLLRPLPTLLLQSLPTPQLAQRPPSQLTQPLPAAAPSPSLLRSSVASAQPQATQPPGTQQTLAPVAAATTLPPTAASGAPQHAARSGRQPGSQTAAHSSQQQQGAGSSGAGVAAEPTACTPAADDITAAQASGSAGGDGVDRSNPPAEGGSADASDSGLAAWLRDGGSGNSDDEDLARLLGSGFAAAGGGKQEAKKRSPPLDGFDVVCDFFGIECPAQRPRMSP